jgi:2-methylisocitrate lyase-like PEP mutase family enzyme
MTAQRTSAARFRDLHVPGRPLILFNVWDAGSARIVAEAGALAIATGSWSVAAAFGFDDGEHVPLELALENARRIVAAVAVPVTIDFEGAYAEQPAEVARNVEHLVATGAVGLNFEDRIVAGWGLHDLTVQAGRITAARRAADAVGVPLFINARTDVFLQAPAEAHPGLVEAALARGCAYAEAGADGFFVPGLVDASAIGRIAREVPLPLNVLARPSLPPARRLAELGVARLSHGPGPYRRMAEALGAAARKAFAAAGATHEP